jgi:hypothetical protein
MLGGHLKKVMAEFKAITSSGGSADSMLSSEISSSTSAWTTPFSSGRRLAVRSLLSFLRSPPAFRFVLFAILFFLRSTSFTG